VKDRNIKLSELLRTDPKAMQSGSMCARELRPVDSIIQRQIAC
jgi:hypothetical protein